MPIEREDAPPPYVDMDPEVVPLCRALNSLPGITTVSSCCGHGTRPFTIGFQVEPGEQRGLFLVTRCTDRRYWRHGDKWTIRLSVADVFIGGRLPVWYDLESQDTGEAAYEQAQDLVRNLRDHLAKPGWWERYVSHGIAAPGPPPVI